MYQSGNWNIYGCDYYIFLSKTHYYLKSVIKLGKLEDVMGIFEPLKSGNQE